MLKLIIKRILMLIPVVLCIILIVFTIMEFTPGDPARLILGEKATQEQVGVLREQMGLNEPFFVRYVNYIVDIAHGDFGRSYLSNVPVNEIISARFPNTLKLATMGMLLSVIIGMPIGILSAVKQYTVIDSASIIFALLGASIPTFWLAMMLMIIFSLNLNWFPSSGFTTIRHMILPSITLAFYSAAVIMRMTRSSMLEVIRQDFIRTARAKGASEKRVIMRHALKNSIIPVITVVGVNFGLLLGGAVVTETVFAIPGLGPAMVAAIRTKDNPIVLASVILIAVAFSIINLCVDILYAFIDPRLRNADAAEKGV